MVEFGKTLAKSKRAEWADFYLDYERLKQFLKVAKADNRDSSNHHRRSQSLDLSMMSSSSLQMHDSIRSINYPTLQQLEFQRALDQELEKVVLFSLELQGKIAQALTRLAPLRQACRNHIAQMACQESPYDHASHHLQHNDGIEQQQIQSNTTTTTATTARQLIQQLHAEYQIVAHQILDYMCFVDLNVTGVRKILKKHDKHHPRQALGPTYFHRADNAYSHLQQLLHNNDPVAGLSALVGTLRQALEELHQAECWLVSSFVRKQQPPPQLHTILPNAKDSMIPQYYYPQQQQLSPLSTSDGIYQQHPMMIARLDADIVTEITQAHEPLLDQIDQARSRLLQQSTKYVELVAAQALFFETDDDDDNNNNDARGTTQDLKKKQWSSLLNLASTFFYMTNYYIVAPTTGEYAMKLGCSTPAYAGIIIGMTPNAALAATILYGWWSNHSYKSALLFAAACSILGNIAYALALPFHSLTLVMVGRFLNGFGSARSINRRFIADTFGRAERTAASAAFVTAGALGMAAGPAIAAIVGQWEYTHPSLSTWWTVETAPGYIMMVLWSFYFGLCWLYFEEPDRSHLFGKNVVAVAKNNHKSSSSSKSKRQQRPPPSSHETQALLLLPPAHDEQQQRVTQEASLPLFRNIPVLLTLWVYFVLKLVLEALLSSCATLTKYYFAWDSQHTGTFLALLGLLMFPANMVVARLSQRGLADRDLIRGTLMVMLVSVAGILSFGNYELWHYVVASICIFVSTNVLEGPNMSLLSKTIPKAWAKGIFNSGFLATEAGTAARSVGDVFISLAFSVGGLPNLLNATFVPLLVLVGISVAWVQHAFDSLVEDEDTDDDDEDDDFSETQSIKSAKALSTVTTQSMKSSMGSRQSSFQDE